MPLVTRGFGAQQEGNVVTFGLGQGFESVIKRVMGAGAWHVHGDPIYGEHVYKSIEEKAKLERERQEQLARELREEYAKLFGRAPTIEDVKQTNRKARKITKKRAKKKIKQIKRDEKVFDLKPFKSDPKLAKDVAKLEKMKDEYAEVQEMIARLFEREAELREMQDEEEAAFIVMLALEDDV